MLPACKEQTAFQSQSHTPWPKGLRADSLPWFDSPLVQGASRLRYTDKAQVAATGPYWPKGAGNKKKSSLKATRALQVEHNLGRDLFWGPENLHMSGDHWDYLQGTPTHG